MIYYVYTVCWVSDFQSALENSYYEIIMLMLQTHTKNVENCKTIIKQLKRQVALKTEKNSILNQQLAVMQVTVAERTHLYEATGTTVFPNATISHPTCWLLIAAESDDPFLYMFFQQWRRTRQAMLRSAIRTSSRGRR